MSLSAIGYIFPWPCGVKSVAFVSIVNAVYVVNTAHASEVP